MSMSAQNGAGMWSCYTKDDPETGMVIAHCLNLHVIVAGRNHDEARGNLLRVLKAHYEYCVMNDPAGLNIAAPMSYWAEYNAAFEKTLREDPDSIIFEHIEFNLRLPLVPEQRVPLSCQGVKIAQTAPAAV